MALRKFWLAIALVLATASLQSAFAWGKDGHEVVGKIAEKNLGKKARAAVDEILKDHQFKGLSDTFLVNWADAIRSSAKYKEKYPKASMWHYIDIDVDGDIAKVDVAKIAGDTDCVYTALLKMREILKDPKQPLQERREALFFIAHFIGDFHQPLHCAERNKDKGGNLVKVKLSATATETPNLHKVWDTDMVAKAMGSLTTEDYANRLYDDAKAETIKEYRAGKLDEWMLECHKLARAKVYLDKGEALKAEGHILSEDYQKEGAAAVEVQLLKGGLRLAQFLDDTFAD